MREMSYRQLFAGLSLALLLLGFPALGFGQTTFTVPFSYQIGGPVPTSVQYNVGQQTPGIALTLTTDSATWVSASLDTNITPSVLTISVSPTSLQAGTYNSTIQITSSQGSLVFNVTLTVTGAAGTLTLSPTAFTFTAVAGGVTPASQTLTVTAQTNISANAQASPGTSCNSTWLTLSPTGNFTAGTSNSNFTVSVSQSGLTAGTTCTGTISMTTAGGAQTATVTLNVTAPTVSGLTLSSSALTFNAAAGGAAPASQTLTVTAQTNTSATASVSEGTCTTVSWLSLSPTGSFTAGLLNANFTVSVNPTGIAGGTTCTGTISMSTAAGTQNASVTLTVTGLTTSTLTVSPSSLAFSAIAGGAAPRR